MARAPPPSLGGTGTLQLDSSTPSDDGAEEASPIHVDEGAASPLQARCNSKATFGQPLSPTSEIYDHGAGLDDSVESFPPVVITAPRVSCTIGPAKRKGDIVAVKKETEGGDGIEQRELHPPAAVLDHFDAPGVDRLMGAGFGVSTPTNSPDVSGLSLTGVGLGVGSSSVARPVNHPASLPQTVATASSCDHTMASTRHASELSAGVDGCQITHGQLVDDGVVADCLREALAERVCVPKPRPSSAHRPRGSENASRSGKLHADVPPKASSMGQQLEEGHVLQGTGLAPTFGAAQSGSMADIALDLVDGVFMGRGLPPPQTCQASKKGRQNDEQQPDVHVAEEGIDADDAQTCGAIPEMPGLPAPAPPSLCHQMQHGLRLPRPRSAPRCRSGGVDLSALRQIPRMQRYLSLLGEPTTCGTQPLSRCPLKKHRLRPSSATSLSRNAADHVPKAGAAGRALRRPHSAGALLKPAPSPQPVLSGPQCQSQPEQQTAARMPRDPEAESSADHSVAGELKPRFCDESLLDVEIYADGHVAVADAMDKQDKQDDGPSPGEAQKPRQQERVPALQRQQSAPQKKPSSRATQAPVRSSRPKSASRSRSTSTAKVSSHTRSAVALPSAASAKGQGEPPPPPTGWRKLPETKLQGPRHNVAGNVHIETMVAQTPAADDVGKDAGAALVRKESKERPAETGATGSLETGIGGQHSADGRHGEANVLDRVEVRCVENKDQAAVAVNIQPWKVLERCPSKKSFLPSKLYAAPPRPGRLPHGLRVPNVRVAGHRSVEDVIQQRHREVLAHLEVCASAVPSANIHSTGAGCAASLGVDPPLAPFELDRKVGKSLSSLAYCIDRMELHDLFGASAVQAADL